MSIEKWIARDSDKSLWIFDEKPSKGDYGRFFSTNRNSYQIDKEFLPEVTHENSPVRIKIKLKEAK